MEHVRELYLTYNEITKIPPSISRLSNLERLYIGDNKLTSLPAELFELHNSLTWLICSSNNLRIIPRGISKLTNLRQLYLENNNLTQISCAITNLTSLHTLYLEGNDALPRSVARNQNRDYVCRIFDAITVEFKGYNCCQRATVAVLCIFKYRRSESDVGELPYEIGVEIAKHVYASREESMWEEVDDEEEDFDEQEAKREPFSASEKWGNF